VTAAPRRGRRVLLAAAVGVVLLVPARAALAQPAVTATATCSPDGSATYQLTVAGTEFPPQAQVTVTFTAVGQADPAAQPDDQTTTSDAAGTFAVQQQDVPVGQTAAFTVQAASGATVATDELDAPACPPAGETTTSTTIENQDQADQITLSPTAGVPGTVVTVTGRGFEPGARLRLRWDRGLGEDVVTVGPLGTFLGRLLIFRKDIIGPRRLLIEPDEPGAGAAPATTATTLPGVATTATTLPGAGVDEEALTFLVLPARQSPAVYGPASQVR
jgi:hypothetical protein